MGEVLDQFSRAAVAVAVDSSTFGEAYVSMSVASCAAGAVGSSSLVADRQCIIVANRAWISLSKGACKAVSFPMSSFNVAAIGVICPGIGVIINSRSSGSRNQFLFISIKSSFRKVVDFSSFGEVSGRLVAVGASVGLIDKLKLCVMLAGSCTYH